MSENEELVRRSYEHWNRGDLDGFAAFLAPDVEIDLSNRVFNPRSYEGHEGLREWAQDLTEVWADWKMEPVEIRDGGERLFVAVRARGRGRVSGAPIDEVGYNVLTLRDRKAVRIKFFYDREQALEAAGLSFS